MPTQPDLSKTFSETFGGKRAVITGGCGFIGSHIADLLVDAGAQVVLIDNMVRGRLANVADTVTRGDVRIIEGDIRDAALLDAVIPGTDFMFHQAALRITHCAAEPREAFEVMATATFDILQRCVAENVGKVVMASSASIYGMAQNFPTPESDNPYNNRTLYGAAKTFGEGLLRSFNDMYDLDYVALRYFNAYGPRMDIHGKYTEVLIRWMERLAAGQPPIIFGDGMQTMDMIHVTDIARANVLAAASDASDVVYNVGSGTETSLRDLAIVLAKVFDREDLVPVHEAERAVNPVPKRLADVSAARDEIGFESTVDLETGIAELVDWWWRERDNIRTAAE